MAAGFPCEIVRAEVDTGFSKEQLIDVFISSGKSFRRPSWLVIPQRHVLHRRHSTQTPVIVQLLSFFPWMKLKVAMKTGSPSEQHLSNISVNATVLIGNLELSSLFLQTAPCSDKRFDRQQWYSQRRGDRSSLPLEGLRVAFRHCLGWLLHGGDTRQIDV